MSPSLKFSPYKNSWNASDLVTRPEAIPNNAPVKGPPGKKNDGSKPNPAPINPPIFIGVLFSLNRSCKFLGINPPKRLSGSSGSFSPNNQSLNLSDSINKDAAVPANTAPIGPPGKNIEPNSPALLKSIVLPAPINKPLPNALGNLDLISSANSVIVFLLSLSYPAKEDLPNMDSLNISKPSINLV